MSFAKSLKAQTIDVWDACYNHPFVQEIGRGVLPHDVFVFYLKQDYKYLLEYAKVFALGVTRTYNEQIMANLSLTQSAVLHEMEGHRQYMLSHGISLEEANATKSSLFNKAYTANMMTEGFNGGLVELMATVLPCAWTYGDFALRLKADFAHTLANNPYKNWIEAYAGEEYQSSFQWFFPAMDELCRDRTERELDAIVDIFRTSVEFEYLFWDMAYKKQMSF